MLNVFIRSLIIYSVVLIVIRIMGKRQIAQLQPFELVTAIMIAELASIPMEDVGVPLVKGLVPIFALVISQVVLSYVTLKSERARALICGSPSIIIKNGIIRQQELQKQRINLNDLLELLRVKNIADIEDVEFAILETNGDLSVFPKSDLKAVTLSDMQIPGKPEDIPVTLIMDGHVLHRNLKYTGKDINWLYNQINAKGFSFKDIFFAYINTQGSLKIIAKEKNKIS